MEIKFQYIFFSIFFKCATCSSHSRNEKARVYDNVELFKILKSPMCGKMPKIMKKKKDVTMVHTSYASCLLNTHATAYRPSLDDDLSYSHRKLRDILVYFYGQKKK